MVHKLLENGRRAGPELPAGRAEQVRPRLRELHEKHPRLIYLSISAYGQTGPLSDRPGYDPVLQAESGMMSVNGEANGEGLRHAIAIVDTMTAIHSVAAINAALYARTIDRQGPAHRSRALRHRARLARQHGLLLPDRRRAAAGAPATAISPRRPTARSRPANGKIYMAVANQKLFTDTCKALGHPEWATDPRFAAHRRSRRQQARADAHDGRRAQDRHQGELGAQVAPPAGRPDPHHEGGARRARGQAPRHAQDLQAQHGVGEVPLIGSNYRFSDTPVDDTRPPPALGEHTDRVLQELAGLSAAEIAALREKKVIG